jgi:hypothetical protein
MNVTMKQKYRVFFFKYDLIKSMFLLNISRELEFRTFHKSSKNKI